MILARVLHAQRQQGGGDVIKVYCGTDWAEKHHHIGLVDEAGTVIAQRRIAEARLRAMRNC